MTRNVMFVSTAGAYGTPGVTYAVDLDTHLTVWSYPAAGDFALSGQGVLYIAQASGKVAAISLR